MKYSVVKTLFLLFMAAPFLDASGQTGGEGIIGVRGIIKYYGSEPRPELCLVTEDTVYLLEGERSFELISYQNMSVEVKGAVRDQKSMYAGKTLFIISYSSEEEPLKPGRPGRSE